MPIALLSPHDFSFPDPEAAETEPNGLLAIGGDLKPERLLSAYRSGVFPWFDSDDDPVLWWSPNPRAVLWPERVRVSRSLRRRLKRGEYRVTFDTAFADVVHHCATVGERRHATWITPGMAHAYRGLHALGYAHSVEVWHQDTLAGGLYGVSIGALFFGESMFSRHTDASKVALVRLVELLQHFQTAQGWKAALLDCQVMNPHLASMGAEAMPRREFLQTLHALRAEPTARGAWIC